MKRFTLIELMMSIGVLVILIGIGTNIGTKVMRAQTAMKRNAAIVVIKSAIEQYKFRWGSYPDGNGPIKFHLELSSYPLHHDYDGDDDIDTDDWNHSLRDLYIKDLTYDDDGIYDPFEEPYKYKKTGDVTYEIQ